MIHNLLSNLFLLTAVVSLFFVFSGLGLAVLNRSTASFSFYGERLFFAFSTGAGIIGYAFFFLSAAQLLYPAYIYGVLTLLLIASLFGIKSIKFRLLVDTFSMPTGISEKVAAAGTLILLSAALILTMTPETGKDALVYHLAAPKLYLKHHGFYFIPGSIYSNLPFQAEMLYMASLFIQGDLLAKGLNFIAFPVVLLGIWQLSVHKMGNRHPYTSIFIFVMIPSVFELAHISYADMYATLFVMGAVYAFIQWNQNEENAWIIIAALFTGLSASTKYSTLILPFLGFLGILLHYRNTTDGKLPFRIIALYLSVTAIAGSPFYIKNWLLTGNPLYPFYYGIFGGKDLDQEIARSLEGLYKYMGMGRELTDYLLLPWNMSFNARMNSSQFDGMIGPVFLLLLPLLFFIRKKGITLKIVIIYCLVSFVFWASSSQDIRYLVPVLPFLTILCGVVFTHFKEHKGIMTYSAAVIVCCAIFNSSLIFSDFKKIRPFPFILGFEDRSAFLNRSLSTYKMYSIASYSLPANANLFLINMRNYTFLCDINCYSDTMFETETLKKILANSSTGKEVQQKLKGRGFTHLMYDELYVIGEKSLLSAADKSLFIEFVNDYLKEISRDRTYRLCAL